jgi:hypothetical protein
VDQVGQAATQRALNAPTLDDLYAQYPSLREAEHNITSIANDEYNCVAWVPKELDRWYEPGIYWPKGIPEPDDERDLCCYVALFESWDFEPCDDAAYEPGFLKVALYEHQGVFKHVAKQLRDGTWSSKAGVLHDFRHHALDDLHPSGIMENARPSVFMRRPDDGSDPQHLERTGLIPA